ncbi:hypothetical protein CEUSTIGMA_g9391.t1 [Chlamydomonas eustigma]|uniref:Beta-glucuronidase C-terminal domain-containing protein n=1 Tax=Chlamydomonas eustigma TaxID=1157962 RepID=A0A250XFY3_9CHLO|nr:hypothetical protein CEUSTIGMA_g9391.t1 [Chlamydomonas eustigma]|eukprot:GAX81963.1 hypothetical protein CEUSTIGMA_g9391.t1 [Chlamydomonas eustigma]
MSASKWRVTSFNFPKSLKAVNVAILLFASNLNALSGPTCKSDCHSRDLSMAGESNAVAAFSHLAVKYFDIKVTSNSVTPTQSKWYSREEEAAAGDASTGVTVQQSSSHYVSGKRRSADVVAQVDLQSHHVQEPQDSASSHRLLASSKETKTVSSPKQLHTARKKQKSTPHHPHPSKHKRRSPPQPYQLANRKNRSFGIPPSMLKPTMHASLLTPPSPKPHSPPLPSPPSPKPHSPPLPSPPSPKSHSPPLPSPPSPKPHSPPLPSPPSPKPQPSPLPSPPSPKSQPSPLPSPPSPKPHSPPLPSPPSPKPQPSPLPSPLAPIYIPPLYPPKVLNPFNPSSLGGSPFPPPSNQFLLSNSSFIPVPSSFVGLSIEPMASAAGMLSNPQFSGLVQLLSSYNTGPFIIRWGGGTQDFLTTVLPNTTWQSMADLSNKTGAKYMIGLNLRAGPTLAVAQTSAALSIIPSSSILAFNIGNEPDLYPKLFGYPGGYWTSSTGWFKDVLDISNALEPLMMRYFGTTKLVSGPAGSWTNPSVKWSASDAAKFAAPPAPLSAYAAMFTMHYYVAAATTDGASIDTFMGLSTMTDISSRVVPWVSYSQTYNLPFRIEETNTLSLGGLAGASNVMAAALYYIDYSLTMIEAGVSGLNFHDSVCYSYSPITFPAICVTPAGGNGSIPLTGQAAGCPATCGMQAAPPTVNAPFYGMLMTQMALKDQPSILVSNMSAIIAGGGVNSISGVRLHVLSANNGQELRVVAVMKTASSALNLNLPVIGLFGTARLYLLTAPSYLATASDITLAGQQVNSDGTMNGTQVVQVVQAILSTASTGEPLSSYSFTLPYASAVLLVMPTLSGRST